MIRLATTIERPGQVSWDPLSSLSRLGVAAESAYEIAPAGSRVGPTTAHGVRCIAGAATTRGGVLPRTTSSVSGTTPGSGAGGRSNRPPASERGRGFNVVVDGMALERLGTRLRVGVAMATATCAFCAREVEIAFAVTMVLYAPSVDDESQTLHCHGACLTERIDRSIPLHPGFDDA